MKIERANCRNWAERIQEFKTCPRASKRYALPAAVAAAVARPRLSYAWEGA